MSPRWVIEIFPTKDQERLLNERVDMMDMMCPYSVIFCVPLYLHTNGHIKSLKLWVVYLEFVTGWSRA